MLASAGPFQIECGFTHRVGIGEHLLLRSSRSHKKVALSRSSGSPQTCEKIKLVKALRTDANE